MPTIETHGRMTLAAYANQEDVSVSFARKQARMRGLIVHKNAAGNEFVSTAAYERRHPLNLQG